MKTLLLVPTPLELDLLRPQLKFLPDRNAAIDVCGFGLVTAGILTSARIAQHRPESVLLAGIAGTLSSDLPVGTACSFDSVAVYGLGVGQGADFRTAGQLGWSVLPGTAGAAGDADAMDDILTLNPTPADPHRLVSVCSASASPAQADHKRIAFPTAMAEDMEGFAVALACRLAGIPCRIIRGISNVAGDRDKAGWQIPQALTAAAALIQETLT